ncbi:hypothetical protein [Actinomadura sp. 9N407]|uniref:DUF7455 domain-containing protein n=1 Tax=Actinomadura sp. 9N407 TaxID=3375154 RepID=UPI0037BD41E5
MITDSRRRRRAFCVSARALGLYPGGGPSGEVERMKRVNTRLLRPFDPHPGEQIDANVHPFESGIRWSSAIAKAEHACCCTAGPVVAAVLTRAKGRPTELLFCRHHFIASRPALEAAHATVYDAQGRLVTSGDVQIP